jgi:DNA-binding Lrp family transcriptional regulator
MPERSLDERDRAVVNRLQDGIAICERPFLQVAADLGMSEEELIGRLQSLLDSGVLTRFGPMYNIERAGGAFALAAMRVPEEQVGRVADMVNACPEVAHNYLREHRFNLWFVLATAQPGAIAAVASRIERETGLRVYLMPKEHEYFLDLRLRA